MKKEKETQITWIILAAGLVAALILSVLLYGPVCIELDWDIRQQKVRAKITCE